MQKYSDTMNMNIKCFKLVFKIFIYITENQKLMLFYINLA